MNELIVIEQEKADADKKAREADTDHKCNIQNEILDALIAQSLTVDVAKTVISAIAKGNIPHVTINY